jgi:hypothetical protein
MPGPIERFHLYSTDYRTGPEDRPVLRQFLSGRSAADNHDSIISETYRKGSDWKSPENPITAS